MQTPPRLTDQPALHAHRARAAQMGHVNFLHEEARDELQERLTEVNRTFTKVAIVTGHARFWAQAFPDATIVADRPTLALERGAFDLVLHVMALHWADDPVGQLVQCRNALRPDGLFLGVCFGGQTLQELRAAFAQAETDLRGGLCPRVAPMAEIRDLGALLQRAGFALPVADASPRKATYASALHLMRELRGMGETNALALRERHPLRRDVLTKTCDIYAQAFSEDSARIRATFDFMFLTGWAPSDDQPQPLRPGSAGQRLADALGTVEYDRDLNPVNTPATRDDT